MQSGRRALLDKVTDKAIEAGTAPMFRGGCASAIGLMLVSVTPSVPEVWELWYQWPCFGLFASGIGRVFIATLWK